MVETSTEDRQEDGMKRRIRQYVQTWEHRGYLSGIPDEAPAELEAMNKAPSYRAVCLAILKNDMALSSLGFSRPKCAAYMELKRIEIAGRK